MTFDVATRRRVASVVCSLVAAVLACGRADGPGDSSRLATLPGRVVSDRAVIVLPGPGWFDDGGRWQVRGEASLICFVDRSPETPLVFSFSAPLSSMTILCDDRDVTGSVRAGEREVELRLDSEALSPGPHELTFLTKESGVPIRFDSLGYRLGDAREEFRVADRLRYSYASSLLSRGVTGINSLDLLGGFLFDGRQRLELPGGAATRFTTTLENGSFSPAEFVVASASGEQRVRVPPFERRASAFALPERQRVTLSVLGDESGMFLWGAPLLQRDSRDRDSPIVIVTLDTVRRDVLGPYGGNPARTPALTAFAREATVYTAAYSTTSWTLPAHASIFTGLYQSRHGAGVTANHLGAQHRTLAESLRDRGYDTAGFAGGLLCKFRSGLAQGFLTYRDPNGFETPDAELTNHVLARMAAPRGGAPLFLFVNYFGSHFPYEAPQAIADAVTPPFRRALRGDGEAWERIVAGEVKATGEDVRALRDAYLASVSTTDTQLARLFRALRERGLYDDALIIVVSDHGELLGEGGLFMHGSRLDDELVAVPLLIKWPGQKTGARDDGLVSIVDLFPTVLAVAGVPSPRSDGIDLAPAGAESRARRRAVIVEEHETPFHPLYPNMKIDAKIFRLQERMRMMMVMRNGRVCHLPEGSRWRAVDCTAPEASDMPSVPELVRTSLSTSPGGRREMDEEQIRNLRALGYLR